MVSKEMIVILSQKVYNKCDNENRIEKAHFAKNKKE